MQRIFFEMFNDQGAPDARERLRSFCGSPAWVIRLTELRPYSTFWDFMAEAEKLWFSLDESEWLAAFACHPRIGETKAPAAATQDFAASSTSEQSTAQETLSEVAEDFLAANRAYEEKFGFLYIVFANGRTAPELLAILQKRLTNDRPTELLEGAKQQWLITQLRMTRYFQS